jgi:hypothetical protein
MNLMLNGIEAMKETGGVLTVKTGRAEGGQLLISVRSIAMNAFDQWFASPQFLDLSRCGIRVRQG